MDFNIRDERPVAQVSKRWFSWSDTYGVDITGDEDPVFILALVIVLIKCFMIITITKS